MDRCAKRGMGWGSDGTCTCKSKRCGGEVLEQHEHFYTAEAGTAEPDARRASNLSYLTPATP